METAIATAEEIEPSAVVVEEGVDGSATGLHPADGLPANGVAHAHGVKGNGNGNGNGKHPPTDHHAPGYANGNGNGNGKANGNGHAHRVGIHGNGASIEASLPLALLSAAFESNGAGFAIPRNGAEASLAGLASLSTEAAPGAGRISTESFYLRVGKRVLDILIAVVGLVFTAPVLFLFAFLIKLDSRGPVLYKSTRLGKNGKPFTFYKLRSMRVGAHQARAELQHLNEVDGPVFKLSRDPRTTRIGRFIRQTSIDELPQFVNVLCGEMTLVGPRPPLPEEVEKYESWHRRRLGVKPGLTCLWQISGRSRLGFNEWMRLDLEYINRQSFSTDMKILLRTIPAVLSREGAY